MSSNNKQILFITGMHRSGTSFFSNLFSKISDFKLSNKLIKPSHDNTDGFYEDIDFVELNEEMLNYLNIDHLTIKFFKKNNYKELLNKFEKNASKLIDEKLKENNLLILKDPRLCYLMFFWRTLLSKKKIPFKIIFCFRNPLDVSASLRKRNSLTVNYALKLWFAYNYNLLVFNLRFIQKYLNFDEFIKKNFAFSSKDIKSLKISNFDYSLVISDTYKSSMIHNSSKKNIPNSICKKTYSLLITLSSNKNISLRHICDHLKLSPLEIENYSQSGELFYSRKLIYLYKKHVENLELQLEQMSKESMKQVENLELQLEQMSKESIKYLIYKIISNIKSSDFFIYCNIGLATFILYYLLIYLFSVIFESPELIITIAYILTILVHYILNRIITFKVYEKVQSKEIFRYSITTCGNYFFQIFSVSFLSNYLNIYLSSLIGAAMFIPVNFIILKWFVFKK